MFWCLPISYQNICTASRENYPKPVGISREKKRPSLAAEPLNKNVLGNGLPIYRFTNKLVQLPDHHHDFTLHLY